MVSKKYTLLAASLCLLASYSFAQVKTGGSYDPSDSSVIPSKRMPQHTEFLNGTYNFPAKPRNQWEIGVKYGVSHIAGDIPSVFFTAPNFGAHIRKSFGYVFSARLEYVFGEPKGLNWKQTAVRPGSVWAADGYAPGSLVYTNYKTRVQDLSLQGVFSLNNIRFHKAKTGVNFYLFGGIGGLIYDARINAANDNTGVIYTNEFNSISGNVYSNRKDTRKALKDVLDDSYETRADNAKQTSPTLFDDTFRPSLTVGGGVAFKLNNKFNLAVEDRWTFVKDDLLDGQQWIDLTTLSRSNDAFHFLSVGLNYNIGKNAVEPLYWLNPLDYAYSEIRNPKLMRLPKPVLPDSDGDGITDQFDQEQTPAGVPVNSHGVALDTDGDGVPDYKDKELITPTYCQPVDADGVGKCPCPDSTCYEGLIRKADDCATTLGALPSVTFKAGSNNLSTDAKAVLSTVAARLRNSPECKVVVIGYCSSSKKEQQLSWDHVNKVINYLVEQEGLSADRFIFNYGQEGGDCNTVDLRGASAGEDGPATVAPPHPNLRKK